MGKITTKALPHPDQPIGFDDYNIIRFKENNIISDLFDRGLLDLNSIAIQVKNGKFPQEDYVQLTQLLGYSVSGWGDLSSSPKDKVKKIDIQAEYLLKKYDILQ